MYHESKAPLETRLKGKYTAKKSETEDHRARNPQSAVGRTAQCEEKRKSKSISRPKSESKALGTSDRTQIRTHWCAWSPSRLALSRRSVYRELVALIISWFYPSLSGLHHRGCGRKCGGWRARRGAGQGIVLCGSG